MISPETLIFGGEKTKDTSLAKLIGVAPSTVGRWRKNPEMIPFGMVEKLARVQGYTISFKRGERNYEY